MGKSKFCYAMMGFDLAFAVLCAMSHSLMFIIFVVGAFAMSYLGDKRYENETNKETL